MPYLSKRGSVYYFRRVVPDDVQPAIGMREIMKSLRTKDRAEAIRFLPREMIASEALFAEARKAVALKAPVPPATSMSREAWEDQQWQDEQASAALFERDMEIERLEPVMVAIKAGTVPDASPDDIAMAGKLLALHEKDEATTDKEIALARLYTQFSASAISAAPADAEAPAGKGVYLDTDILEGWAAERKPEQRGKDMYERDAKLFNKMMGRKSVELISKADVMAYKRKLIEDGRSQVNVRDRLANLRTLLEHAAQSDMIPDNPAKAVRMRVTEKGAKREDWTVPELNTLLAGPVHAKRELPKGAMAGGQAAYWLPLLAIFMGARREELGQLLISDVRLEQYFDADSQPHEAWCINISDNEEAGNRVKNAASRRLVPLHPALIELGFIRYVQGLPAKCLQVFPDLKRSGAGKKLTDKWGQWFTSYRRTLGISDAKVFHGFRHTWKTQAGNSGLAERVSRQFQGHEGRDVADNYGAAPAMHVLVAAISTYRVPGFVLPEPV